MGNGTFNDTAVAVGHPETRFRTVTFEHQPEFADAGLKRAIRRFRFVPDNPVQLDADCCEAFNIQVEGLACRFQVTRGKYLVIGVSGWLELALGWRTYGVGTK